MSTANSTIVGNATIYGVDGTIKYGSVWLGTTNYIQSLNLTDDVDTTEARDQKGNVFGYNLYNFRRTATFEVIFYAATEILAAADFKLPTPGAILEIAQDLEAGSSLPALLVGTWNYIGGGSISGSNTDLMRMSLPCSRYNADSAGDAIALQTFTH
tara:strand:+ start:46 stop:513 length:468 start_codon:yes stop_codon:yes gene_type:complete